MKKKAVPSILVLIFILFLSIFLSGTALSQTLVKPKPYGSTTTMQPIPLSAPNLAGRDYGKGSIKVVNGDVYDCKARRISGLIWIYSGTMALGFTKVVEGYFSLYDLQPGTYQLRFTSAVGNQKVNTNVNIVKGRLSKAVLQAPCAPESEQKQTVVVPLFGRDYGKGNIQVILRGEVREGCKGRYISGWIRIYSGGAQAIGYAYVAVGHFLLYDLKPGTYQLRFTSADGGLKATGNVNIVKGKWPKVVLVTPCASSSSGS